LGVEDILSSRRNFIDGGREEFELKSKGLKE
jgi:hypothetical protein